MLAPVTAPQTCGAVRERATLRRIVDLRANASGGVGWRRALYWRRRGRLDQLHRVLALLLREVGARSVALVVPGSGRADALGVLARIQAACGATGNAVELEPDDDAVGLVSRLLAGEEPRRAVTEGDEG